MTATTRTFSRRWFERAARLGAVLAFLFVAGSALAGPSTRPQSSADDSTARAAAAGSAVPAPLESQSIRRGGSSDNGQNVPLTSAPPQGLGLPRVAGAMAIVIGLILLLRFAGKKLMTPPGTRNSSRAVQVLSRTPLSPRQHIMLLRVGRRVIVVGDCGTQMNALSEITDSDEVATLIGELRDDKSEFTTRAFSSWFHKAKEELPMEAAEIAEADPEDESPPAEVRQDAFDPSHDKPPSDETEIATTRDELTDLVARVRSVSKQFKV